VQRWTLSLAAMAWLAACQPAQQHAPDASQAPEASAPARLMTWPDLTSRPRPEPTIEVKWGEGETDIADLWLPEGGGPHPVVVMVHGGCWQKSIADRTLMNWMAEGLRQQGWAVWNIEYRGVDEPGGGYPGTFSDVAAAADVLSERASAWRLDLDRVTGIGHSAGGHLVLWLAARPQLPAASPLHTDAPLRFRGVVVSGGLADLEASRPVTQPECLDSVYDALTGPASVARPDPLADSSPARLLPIGVPVISVNGSDDRIAPPLLGDGLTRKLEAAGDEAALIVVPDTGHVELIAPDTEAFRLQAEALDSMVRR
jgi:acetyl esterase/lipase